MSYLSSNITLALGKGISLTSSTYAEGGGFLIDFFFKFVGDLLLNFLFCFLFDLADYNSYFRRSRDPLTLENLLTAVTFSVDSLALRIILSC